MDAIDTTITNRPNFILTLLVDCCCYRLVSQRSDTDRRVFRDDDRLCVLALRSGGPLRLLAGQTTHRHTCRSVFLAAGCR